MQVLRIPEACKYVKERIGENAHIVDSIVTTTLPSEQPVGPQRLHFDVKLPSEAVEGKQIGTLVKLLISTTGRPVLTEFGASREPVVAPAVLFDSVRCITPFLHS